MARFGTLRDRAGNERGERGVGVDQRDRGELGVGGGEVGGRRQAQHFGESGSGDAPLFVRPPQTRAMRR